MNDQVLQMIISKFPSREKMNRFGRVGERHGKTEIHHLVTYELKERTMDYEVLYHLNLCDKCGNEIRNKSVTLINGNQAYMKMIIRKGKIVG